MKGRKINDFEKDTQDVVKERFQGQDCFAIWSISYGKLYNQDILNYLYIFLHVVVLIFNF